MTQKFENRATENMKQKQQIVWMKIILQKKTQLLCLCITQKKDMIENKDNQIKMDLWTLKNSNMIEDKRGSLNMPPGLTFLFPIF